MTFSASFSLLILARIFLSAVIGACAVLPVWFLGVKHPNREKSGTVHQLISGVGSWLHVHHLISPLTNSTCQRTLNQRAFGPLHSFPLVENWLSADLIACITWDDISRLCSLNDRLWCLNSLISSMAWIWLRTPRWIACVLSVSKEVSLHACLLATMLLGL